MSTEGRALSPLAWGRTVGAKKATTWSDLANLTLSSTFKFLVSATSPHPYLYLFRKPLGQPETDHGNMDKVESFLLLVYTQHPPAATWRERRKRSLVVTNQHFPPLHPSAPYKGLSWQTHTLWGPAGTPSLMSRPKVSGPRVQVTSPL